MKYFVTGSTGFIGQHLVRRLLTQDNAVVYCLVRDEKKLPRDFAGRVIVLRGGDDEVESHADTIRSCDVIYHLAARASLGDGKAYDKDNVGFTEALLRVAKRTPHLRRFVFTSTIGAVDRLRNDKCTAPLSEESTPHPLTDYGRSKLICEQRIAASDLPYVILRPALVYGPGMRRNSHLRVFIDAVYRGKFFTKVSFPGKVSLVHIADVVDALILAGECSEAVRQTFFVADDEPVALGEIFRVLGSIIGRPAGTIKPFPGTSFFMNMLRPILPLQLSNLFSDVLTASNTRLRSLGFVPRKSLSSGFRETAHDHFVGEAVNRGYAMVTGGASGIGRELCLQLYARGFEIVVVDRDAIGGNAVAAACGGVFVHADLSQSTDVENVRSYLETHGDEITVLINNAGIGARGYTEEIPITRIVDLMTVNSAVPMILSHTMLQGVLKRGSGTIVNIGSSAGYQPLPYMSAYAASKAAVMFFTRGLQGELIGRGVPSSIEVILVSPSGTATNFQTTSGVKNDDAAKLLNPLDVATAIIDRIGKGNSIVTVGLSGKGMAAIARILPQKLQVRLWERLMRVMR